MNVSSHFNFVKFNGAPSHLEKLFFYGHTFPFTAGHIEGQVTGFLTENSIIVNQFNQDIDMLKDNVIEEYTDRTRLISFFEKLIAA